MKDPQHTDSLPHYSTFQVKKGNFIKDKEEVVCSLESSVEEGSQYGQHALLEGKYLPRSEAMVMAIATSICRYEGSKEESSGRPETKPDDSFPLIKRHNEATMNGAMATEKRFKSS